MVISNDSDEKWKYSEHTKVKHIVFSKYFKTWSSILGTYHNLYVFDCFAGRGRYVDGSEGSPLKILKILINLKKTQGKPENAYCHFIEKNKNNHNNLHDEITNFIDQHESLDWLKIKTYCDEFSNILDDIIRDYDNNISPAFFFIDPFGFGGIPLDLIKRILTNPKTEVFITFMTRDVNRFLKSPPHKSSIQELFGCEDVQEKLSQEPYFGLAREQAILKLYRNQLHEEAGVKYTFPFQVKADENLHTVYYLIHCTNHPMGCELMKAIMYKSGTEGRFGYFGPAEGQLLLENFFEVEKLRNFLLEKYKNKTISFKDLIYENLMETTFIRKHYREAILQLEQENQIITRSKGLKQGIKEDTVIVFRKPKNLFYYIEKKKNPE